ncbi:MAG: thiamine pyrophosphate-binding protein, partial [Planctomycetota bacterium]|nr:thiamine pyrophosphate-binding protein [Planctomycetota bacterium]
MKASALSVKALENEGVEFVFGIPGEENLDFLDSLSRSNIRLILTRHQQAAGFMAATYGRLKPGRSYPKHTLFGPFAAWSIRGDSSELTNNMYSSRNNSIASMPLGTLACRMLWLLSHDRSGTSDEESRVRHKNNLRIWAYAGVTAALVVTFAVIENVTWRYGNTQLHTIMEVVATLLAVIVGVVALVRYFARRHNMILFLGVGFIGTALLDGYHAIVTSNALQPFFPSRDFSLIPWSWNASRTFLALLIFLSWLAWRREQKLGQAGRISATSIFVGVSVLALFSFVFFAFVPLGRAYFPEFIFRRPQEFVAGAFFLAALLGYLSKHEWPQDPLEHWIVNSLIVGFLCQTM